MGDTREVIWERLRSESPPLLGPSSYFLVGSWSMWSKADRMDFDSTESAWVATVTVGSTGLESFQVIVDGDWHQILHPSVRDASPSIDHYIMGPGSVYVCNLHHYYFWTISGDEGANV